MWGTTGVSVSPSSLTMTKGETKQLDGSVSYFGSYPGYSWSSNNTNIATVDGAGNVKAIAAGSAKITLTSGTLSASCTVTVKAAAPAPIQPPATKPSSGNTKITGLKLDNLTVEVGEKKKLNITISPSNATNKDLSWTITKNWIAGVSSDGTVTGNLEGTVEVTAKTTDGSGLKSSCYVTVVKSTAKVKSVTLDKSSISLEKGAADTLIGTINPGNAANKKVTWSSSNTDIATVTDIVGFPSTSPMSKVTAGKMAGSATITVTTEDGKKSASCTVTVAKTLEDLYPLINTNPQKNVFVSVSDDTINIDVHANFTGSPNDEINDSGKTYKQLTIEGIKAWAGTYKNVFGRKAIVKVKVTEDENGVIFELKNGSDTSGGNSFGHSYIFPWSTDGDKTVCMFTADPYGNCYETEQISRLATHEMGHVFGLEDAYGAVNDNRPEAAIEDTESNGIMRNQWGGINISRKEIQMLIYAWNYNEWQPYCTYYDADDILHERSEALDK